MKPSLVIIGLGNSGAQYEATRHNVGFKAAEKLAQEFSESEWSPKQKFLADIAEGRIVTVPILLAKPTTFMNNSGNAAQKIIDFFGLDPVSQLLILCDDIDLPVGEFRITDSGGAGSHNGLKSLVSIFGEDFARIRIGVRGSHAPEGSFQQAGEDLSSYVLSSPSAEESKSIEEALNQIPEVVKGFVLGGK